jgi:ATP-dependent DNA ligase
VAYTEGEGNRRNALGSLLLAVYNTKDKSYQFVGHTVVPLDIQIISSILQFFIFIDDIRLLIV